MAPGASLTCAVTVRSVPVPQLGRADADRDAHDEQRGGDRRGHQARDAQGEAAPAAALGAGAGGRSASGPAAASSDASRSTSAMIRAFSDGGGSTGSAETGSARAAGSRSSTSSRQAGQPGEVLLEGRALGLVQRAQQVGGGGVAPVVVSGSGHLHQRITAPSPSRSRSFLRPSRMRPLIVPTGVSSISAISLWVNPPK